MNAAPNKNIPYLDGWRGMAILLVLISHFFFSGNSWLGAFGVMLFFLLSGHLISNLLFIKKVRLGDFLVRRASRILPIFLIFVGMMYVAISMTHFGSERVTVLEAIYSILFLRTYLPAGSDIWFAHWPVAHLWSLNVEEHSYLFLAAGALVCRYIKNSVAVIVFLLATTSIILGVAIIDQVSINSTFPRWYLRSEVASLPLIAAAALRMIRHRWPHEVPSALPVLFILAGIVCFTIYPKLEHTAAPFFLALSMTYIDKMPVLVRQFLSLRVIRWFGVCSFSLYVWQQPFFNVMTKFHYPSLVMLGLGIVVGAASYYIVENPVRLYLNSAWSRRRTLRDTPLQITREFV